MKALLSILRFAFGCRHRQRSGVFTIKNRTYQVCLKCGQEFEYSWALMHALRSSVADSPEAPPNSTRYGEVPVFDPTAAPAPLVSARSYLVQTRKSTPVILHSSECVERGTTADS